MPEGMTFWVGDGSKNPFGVRKGKGIAGAWLGIADGPEFESKTVILEAWAR